MFELLMILPLSSFGLASLDELILMRPLDWLFAELCLSTSWLIFSI